MISGRWFTSKRGWSVVVDTASVLGFLSIIIAVIEFFPSLAPLSVVLKENSSLVTIGSAALIYALVKNRPRNDFLFKVNNRDVEIALKIGSIEKTQSAYIVPVNSEFDMDLNGSVKSATSVKSMIIKKFFAGDSSMIQKRINQELKSKAYLTQKDGGKYKIGTTVRIETEDRKNVFYFVVNSHKLNDKRVEASEDSLAITLSGLWSYISTHGAKEQIAVPLLGTGNGRMKMPREEVYKEIVRSFIASCSGKSYCEKLTIVIRDEDVSKCQINIEELVEFTKLHTQYADFRENGKPSTANSIE